MHRPSQKLIMFGRKKKHSSVAASSRSVHSQNQNGLTNGGGGASTAMPPPVLIQKFIVLHEGLMPLPDHEKHANQQQQRKLRRNPTSMLSEDASLDEHGEFILYYYDHALNAPHKGGRRSSSSVADLSESDKEMRGSLVSAMSDGFSANNEEEQTPVLSYATEDAVRFAGVCRALRSLPMGLRPQKDEYSDDDNDDKIVAETEVVHLSDSTLVFVPLELDGDIVAIAQLPRATNRSNFLRQSSDHSSDSGGHTLHSKLGYGADPSAIQESIRQIHSLFSLMHGGGIHRRLLRTRHLEQSKEWAMEVEDDNFNSSLNDISRESNGNVQPRPIARSNARKTRQLSNSISITDSDNHDYYQDKDGAIHNRSNMHDQNLQDYRYGGMKELFDLRREYRKIQNNHREEGPKARFGGMRMTSRWGSCSNANDLFNGIADELGHSACTNRIDKLLEVLPITTLRKDLGRFYDDWLWRMQGVCDIMKGGVGRCVVEMIPAPLFSLQSSIKTDIPVRGQHPPLAPQPFVCLAGAEFIKSLISDELPQLNGESGLQFSRLLGMSFFHQNRFVLSKMKNEMKIPFPPEIPCMIAEYFHSFSQRREERNFIAEIAKKASEPGDANASRPNHNALERWMSNISINTDDNLFPPIPTPKEVLSGFAKPPEQFGTNEKDQPSFFVPEMYRQIWLPNLHLPCPNIAAMIEHDDAIETHVAMFGKGDFTFLLYFELQDPYGGGSILEQMAEEMNALGGGSDDGKLISGEVIEEEAKAFATLLAFLDSQLVDFCDTYSERDSSDVASTSMAPVKEVNSHRLFQGEVGMDIVHVNRNENSFILLSQHDLSSDEIKRVANETTINETKPKGLFGLGGQKPKQQDHVRPMKYRQTHHGDILDCRHKLAAYLPLDVMHAFDDMFNEVGRLSHRRNVLRLTMNDRQSQSNLTEDSDSINAIELCTFLPQGWVYCHANGDQELYILLDTSKFVTIADVQKAVVRVRERITSLS